MFIAASAMQTLAIAYLATCATLRALKIIAVQGLLISLAMGSVLLACSAILAYNLLAALVMLIVHLVSGMLLITHERAWPPFRRVHWRSK